MSYSIDDNNYFTYNNKRIVYPNKYSALQDLSSNVLDKNKIVIVYLENKDDADELLVYNYINYELNRQGQPYSSVAKDVVKNNIIYYPFNAQLYEGGFLKNKLKLFIINSIEKHINKNPDIINKIIPSNTLVAVFNNNEYEQNIKLVIEYIKNMESVFPFIMKLKNKTSMPLKNILLILFIVINNKKKNNYDVDDEFLFKFLNIIYEPLAYYINKIIKQ